MMVNQILYFDNLKQVNSLAKILKLIKNTGV